MSSWLRRNRWGLAALPVVAVLAVGANTQRLQDYWWDQELRRAGASGAQDEWVSWSDPFSDANGDAVRSFRVKVTGIEQVLTATDEAEELELPAELTGLRVDMDFEAAPDQVLFGCRMALIDDQGNRYSYMPGLGGVLQNLFPCLPEGHPGPQPSITAGEPRVVMPGEERPESWTTRPVVVVPRDARITEVRLWWEQPDYLAVRLD